MFPGGAKSPSAYSFDTWSNVQGDRKFEVTNCTFASPFAFLGDSRSFIIKIATFVPPLLGYWHPNGSGLRRLTLKTRFSPELEKKIRQLSPEKVGLLQQRLATKGTPDAAYALTRRDPKEPRVLSFGQQQLWLVDQFAPGTSAYNVPYALRIRGPLNAGALQRAFDGVVGRHEVLRTLFINFKGQPLPLVSKQWSVQMQQSDLRTLAAEQRAIQILALLKADSARPFNLAKDLKLRASLYRVAEEEYVLSHVSHHISWDLRSKAILYQELAPLYAAFCEGKECTLPEPAFQYADFAAWQRKYLQGEVLGKLVEYWKAQLGDAPAKLELPTDHPRPPVQTLKGAKYPVALSQDLLAAAQRLAQQNGTSLYMLFLSVFYVFLHAYTGESDISVGSPFAGRRKETDSIIGMFTNTLVLRMRLSKELPFRDLLTRVRETTLGAIANQDLPFGRIVEALRPPRDLNRNVLFQVNFRFQAGRRITLELPGLDIQPLDLVDNNSAKFDLALQLPSLPEVPGYFEYNTDLFERSTIRRMAGEIAILAGGLMQSPDQPLKDLECVSRIRRA
jgi:Condensation domain